MEEDRCVVGKSPDGFDCPACIIKRLHTAEERKEYHPYSGHGYTPETGWTGGLKPEEKRT